VVRRVRPADCHYHTHGLGLVTSLPALDGPRTGALLASKGAVRDGQARPGAGILAVVAK